MTFLPLLRQGPHTARQVGIVACRVQRRISPLMSVSLTTCTAPSITMKASQHGGSFLVSLQLISLHPAAKVCGTFSNRASLCSYSGQPEIMAIACAILETPVTSLINNL